MTIAVVIALAIGIPLGVWAARSARVDRAIKPVLDAMQTIPAPVYFIPMVLLFGIRRVPATIATVIYSLPPAVRLTTLGIQGVPRPSVEAAEMYGSTGRQTLFKVQLPMAMPFIMTGVNQTIMMALGIVVLATLLGAGGLGQEVLQALNQRRTGRGPGRGPRHRGGGDGSGPSWTVARLRRQDPTCFAALRDHRAGVGPGGDRGGACHGLGRVPGGMGGQGLRSGRHLRALGTGQPLLHHPPGERFHRGGAAHPRPRLSHRHCGLAGAHRRRPPSSAGG